ncbi:flagellar motor switch protein FliG [Bryobacterales bacterium F-183]|nr:flagellar motor switch protein FliG [Bryobacterales bacterium F-183]
MPDLEKAEEKMSGLRKAAILMVLLGEEGSAGILRNLDEEEVQSISREIAKLSAISTRQAESILEEFYQMSVAGDYVRKGGIDFAKRVLVGAFGPDSAKKMLDRLIKTLGAESASFDALRKVDPQQLAKFIHSEHPQTIALVLSHLSSAQAADLLFSLPPEMRGEVALRMASLDQISPEIITKIAGVIANKLKNLGDVSRENYGGVNAVAEMCNCLDSNTSREILDTIEQSDPRLVETIRQLMFVFEDLLLMDQNAVKELLQRVDRKVLTIALKGTSEQLRNHILSSMSQRGSEMLREDMDSLGPIKIREVETAQQQIIAIVRQLEAEGVISLKGGGGDQYVE